MKSWPPATTEMEERTGTDCSPGLVLFKLVVPPFQPGVVGPYPVRRIWFPYRLSLEGTMSYLDLLGHNRRPTVPRIQDLDNERERWGGSGSLC
jgi:hypothetical protein